MISSKHQIVFIICLANVFKPQPHIKIPRHSFVTHGQFRMNVRQQGHFLLLLEVIERFTIKKPEKILRLYLNFIRQQLKRSEEHTSELQSRENLVCRLLLEKKKKNYQSRKKD